MVRESFPLRVLLTGLVVCLLMGCSSKPVQARAVAQPRPTREEFLCPVSDEGSQTRLGDVTLDTSHTADGYFMLRYDGQASQLRLQLKSPKGSTYTYAFRPGLFAAFPLTEGDGSYQLSVLEHAYDNFYSVAASATVEAKLADPFSPFLYPNYYVWFTPESQAMELGISLSQSSETDLDYVTQVYHYVISHIQYDTAAAETATAEYLPDIDRTLQSGKGICFDYASLMAALLRSQGIPTKLVTGCSGTAFHAWISVYLEEAGWVDNIISFDGESWSLMDPTLAANNSGRSVKKYIGDGSNYTEKFYY